ncbi:hypothetical protein FKM82_009019 [Ascaphus truei]|uniref:vitamin K-dependent protein Z n=1 Tax=Ascaphus truei TaxID=8439 RepID=UPI003F59FB37
MANAMQATCLLSLMLFVHQTEQKVFLSAENANKVMQRSKRANFIMIEEVLKGSLERECLEEICTYEEARETFEDREKTERFWKTYYGGKQCSLNPCMNKGVCKDTIRSYACCCPEGYKGRNCEFAKNECHPKMKDGCQHFCHPGYESYTCSCAHGYILGEDEKSCHPTDPHVCGQVLNDEGSMTIKLPHTNRTHTFPWQVLLLNSEGTPFCSGVILNQSSVLTTAECSNMHSSLFVLAGNTRNVTSEKRKEIGVISKHMHMRYSEETGDNNIALLTLKEDIVYHNHCLPICVPQKDFAENVLIPYGTGMVSGYKLSSEEEYLGLSPIQFTASYLDKDTCDAALNMTQTNRMFCGVSQKPVDSMLTGGGHFAMEHNGTWFLTGIMGSWNPAPGKQDVFLFTKMSRYIMWLKQIIN